MPSDYYTSYIPFITATPKEDFIPVGNTNRQQVGGRKLLPTSRIVLYIADTIKNRTIPFVLVWFCVSISSLFLMALKNIRILCLGFLCFMLFNLSDAWAQSAETRAAEGQTEIKPLAVGDTIPDEFWTADHHFYINGDTVRKTLNEQKGKPLVLDFWATSCKGCISTLVKTAKAPEIDNNEVSLIPVTYENTTTLTRFLVRQPEIQHLNYIIRDKALKKYFPHRFISHVVWIDRAGKIAAVTGSTTLTQANLRKFAKGELEDLPTKEDFAVFRDKPLYDCVTLPADGKVWFSGIKAYQEGLSPTFREETDSTLVVSWRNRAILQLYSNYVHLNYPGRRFNVIWNVPDISIYTWNCRAAQNNSLEEWNREFSKSYEFHTAKTGRDWEPLEYILEDLNKLLGLEVKIDTTHLEAVVTLANEQEQTIMEADAEHVVQIAELSRHLYNEGLVSLLWHGSPDDIIILDRPLRELKTKEQLFALLRANRVGYDTVDDLVLHLIFNN